jgi:hypothetical protein
MFLKKRDLSAVRTICSERQFFSSPLNVMNFFYFLMIFSTFYDCKASIIMTKQNNRPQTPMME